MAKRVLKRKRIAVLAADGFEKVELTIPDEGVETSRCQGGRHFATGG